MTRRIGRAEQSRAASRKASAKWACDCYDCHAAILLFLSYCYSTHTHLCMLRRSPVITSRGPRPHHCHCHRWRWRHQTTAPAQQQWWIIVEKKKKKKGEERFSRSDSILLVDFLFSWFYFLFFSLSFLLLPKAHTKHGRCCCCCCPLCVFVNVCARFVGFYYLREV